MAVNHATGISRQRNSGYRLSNNVLIKVTLSRQRHCRGWINIMAQGLFTPDPPLALHTSL